MGTRTRGSIAWAASTTERVIRADGGYRLPRLRVRAGAVHIDSQPTIAYTPTCLSIGHDVPVLIRRLVRE